MRSVGRIDSILIKLGKLWHKHPDYRFGQLLINYNLAPDSIRFWSASDDDLEEALLRILDEIEV
jgi:hypothetical protein